MFFEEVKVISIETVDGRKVATIEVSSQDALYSYHWRYSNEQKLINVIIPDSCPQAEREVMIKICNKTRGLHYIPGGNTNDDNEEEEEEEEEDKKKDEKDDDDDDDDDDEEEEKNEEEGENNEEHEKEGEKEGEKTQSSCCCN